MSVPTMYVPAGNGLPGATMADRSVVHVPQLDDVNPLSDGEIVTTAGPFTYLMRGVVHCGLCGLTYVGSSGKGSAWYRCGGQLVERGRLAGRCPSRSVRSDWIEPLVWNDIARYLLDPGKLISELASDQVHDLASPGPNAEARALEQPLAELESQRAKTLDLAIRGHLQDHLLEATLARIGNERDDIVRRANTVRANDVHELGQEVMEVIARARERPEADRSPVERAELVRVLVAVKAETEIGADGRKSLELLITYHLPDPDLAGGVVTLRRRWRSERAGRIGRAS